MKPDELEKMNDDGLEEMNLESVSAIQRRFNLGYATASRIQEAVLKTLKTIRSKTRKECAEIAKSKCCKDLCDSCECECHDAARAILKKEEEK